MKGMFTLLMLMCFTITVTAQENGTLTVHFSHTANGKPLTLRDSVYTTPLGEAYTVSKLRYYVSHIQTRGTEVVVPEDPYHLVNFPRDTSITLEVQPGKVNAIEFLLGIDSIRHCSGAQSGALDPMNDMFWTWNSGYVTFKLDGSSPASTADRNRIEHHLGGYRGTQKIAQTISLPLTEPVEISAGDELQITISVNLDQYWNSETATRLSETPVCSQPGTLALRLAKNLPHLFSIQTHHASSP